MDNVVKNTWPLFLGMAFLMLGNGLQGTLISWRASYESFAPSTTGWVMTGYYVGFLFGSLSTSHLLKRVGHIRVFAALASLASTAILVQVVFISPTVWFLMRVLTGLCFAGTYVVVESWLNKHANNQTRGQLFSIYMIVSLGGLTAGQWLMKVSDPAGVTLFIVASILMSLALIPILITPTMAPVIEDHPSMGIRQLFRLSPTGVVSIFGTGILHGAIFAMGATYALKAGMTVSQTVLFMSATIAAGMLTQWPIGWLSDKVDRRLVIVASTLIGMIACGVLATVPLGIVSTIYLFGITGAVAIPLYSLGIAHTNDRLQPEQMVGASGTMVLISGLGAILGPLSVGYLLDWMGTDGYFVHLAVMQGLIAVAVMFYMSKRKAVKEEDQVPWQPVQPRATTVGVEMAQEEAVYASEHPEDD